MTAVAQEVVKLPDGSIPVFASYQAAAAYARTHYGKWRNPYPAQLKRLTKRHRVITQSSFLHAAMLWNPNLECEESLEGRGHA